MEAITITPVSAVIIMKQSNGLGFQLHHDCHLVERTLEIVNNPNYFAFGKNKTQKKLNLIPTQSPLSLSSLWNQHVTDRTAGGRR